MTRFVIACIVAAAVLAPHAGYSADQSSPAPQQARGLFAHKNIEQAWKSAVASKKPLVVMFTSDGCAYCTKMLQETYADPQVKKMLVGHTESVLAHANRYRPLVKKLGIRGYPSTLVVAPDGRVLDFMEGYVEAKTFARRIHPLLRQRTAQTAKPDSSVATTFPKR